jgi:thioredoxin reductase (NADPH)
LYKNKRAAVIGGGDSACQESLYLARFAEKVIIVHRRDKLRAVASLAEKAMRDPKIEFAWNSLVLEVEGETAVTGLRIKNRAANEERSLAVDGVFIYIGLTPNLNFAEGLFKRDETGFIITDDHMRTDAPNVYAIGDVRSTPLRQVVTACADGAIAAHAISNSL